MTGSKQEKKKKARLILHTSGLLNKSAQTRTCLYNRDKNSSIKIIQLLTAGIVIGPVFCAGLSSGPSFPAICLGQPAACRLLTTS